MNFVRGGCLMIDFEQLKFKYEFRDYQQRALNEIHQYVQDDKIHIVAAPGAGKTILALQLLLELKQRAVIFVPTIALREQWIQRFKEDFAAGQDVAEFISDDLKDIRTFTVTTYQALHSACKDDATKVTKTLTSKEIGIIVLDEAHHLKSSWWRSLKETMTQMKNIKLISLTATPPYDEKNSEWQKYIELCGEIDVEITIAELVGEDNLCPHQDYIYFNFPTNEHLKEIESYYQKRDALFDELCDSKELVTAVSLHHGVIDLTEHIDYFLINFDYYLSLRSFLQYKGVPVAKLTNERDRDIPAFNIEMMEVLLTNCLYADKNSYRDFAKFFKEIKSQLNEIGAIHQSKVRLVNNQATTGLITQNLGKLNSINTIVSNEYQALQDRLKLAIIADYIRDDISEIKEEAQMNMIGVIPIFRSMRKEVDQDIKIVVLTGSVVIIPAIMREALTNICHQRNLPPIEATELAYDFDYCCVWVNERMKRYIVSIITELFAEHDIQVLIGTNALLGEGWDAPCVNALIMATFISSFVTSNQIRGRAIRKSKKDENKTANIWHLVCLEKKSNGKYSLGVDYDKLKRRFEAFEGVCLNEEKIAHGIERMGIDNEGNLNLHEVESMNEQMKKAATARDEMKSRWREALKNYTPFHRSKIPASDYEPVIQAQRKAMIKTGVVELAILTAMSVCLLHWLNIPPVLVYITLVSLGMLVGLKSVVRGKDKYIIGKFSKALMATLVEIKMIDEQSEVVVEAGLANINFYMAGGSTIENFRYNSCLKEMLSPIEVPRYLIKIKKRYYPVPQVLGKNKQWAQILEKNLKKEFGRTKLLYTKTLSGKQQLLEIKMQRAKAQK